MRESLCKEGLNLLMDDYHCIHTWQYHELWGNNNEDREDDFIIACARRLQEEQEEVHYQVAARLIGEVLGHMEELREVEWIEYRLRQLIQQGIFFLSRRATRNATLQSKISRNAMNCNPS